MIQIFLRDIKKLLSFLSADIHLYFRVFIVWHIHFPLIFNNADKTNWYYIKNFQFHVLSIAKNVRVWMSKELQLLSCFSQRETKRVRLISFGDNKKFEKITKKSTLSKVMQRSVKQNQKIRKKIAPWHTYTLLC